MNGGDENRVHLPNIELSYIRQLQHDNSELRCLLEEHQAALEVIMGRYRQQVYYGRERECVCVCVWGGGGGGGGEGSKCPANIAGGELKVVFPEVDDFIKLFFACLDDFIHVHWKG